MAKKHGNGAANSPARRGGGPLSPARTLASTEEPPSDISPKPKPPSEFFKAGPAQVDAPKPKKRGRPKGLPKTGGRIKNKPGRLGREAREYLAKHSNYLETICRIAAGKSVKMSGPTGKLQYWYPDISDRKWALNIAIDKLLPSVAASEISGPEGVPLIPPVSNRDLALKVAHVLTRPGSGGEGIVAELVKGTEGTEGSAEEGRPAFPGRSGAGGMENGVVSPLGGPCPPASRGNGAEKPKPALEPEIGQTARVGGYIILCGPPQREGLPRSYRILGTDGKLIAISSGGWAGALKWVKQRAGEDADMSVEITSPTPPGWGEPLPQDQRSPQVPRPEVFHDHESRRRR